MALFEDNRPIRKLVHEIGQDISSLAVEDLNERIGLLKAEIARLDAEKIQKNKSKAAAQAFFR